MQVLEIALCNDLQYADYLHNAIPFPTGSDRKALQRNNLGFGTSIALVYGMSTHLLTTERNMRNAYYTISAEKNGEKFGNSTMDYDVAKSLMGTYLDLGYTVTLRYYVRAPRN